MVLMKISLLLVRYVSIIQDIPQEMKQSEYPADHYFELERNGTMIIYAKNKDKYVILLRTMYHAIAHNDVAKTARSEKL